jgi:hypothetical protein
MSPFSVGAPAIVSGRTQDRKPGTSRGPGYFGSPGLASRRCGRQSRYRCAIYRTVSGAPAPGGTRTRIGYLSPGEESPPRLAEDKVTTNSAARTSAICDHGGGAHRDSTTATNATAAPLARPAPASRQALEAARAISRIARSPARRGASCYPAEDRIKNTRVGDIPLPYILVQDQNLQVSSGCRIWGNAATALLLSYSRQPVLCRHWVRARAWSRRGDLRGWMAYR